MNQNAKQEVISWIKTIGLAILLAWVVTSFLIVNATVPTGSMENTIMTGDRIIANRLAYWQGEPQRGDIAVFRYPDDPSGKTLFVKRIIGLPGDVVEVREGQVYINGASTALEESYLKETPYGNFGPYEVPEGQYFMMGDNRNNSLDSRSWRNHYVPKKDILGKVLFRYFRGFKWLA
jgi:signal peptidase I